MRHRWIQQATAAYTSVILTMLCGLGLLQPPATAAESSLFSDLSKDWMTEPVGNGEMSQQILRLRCRQETLPKTTQNLSNSSILQTVVLKQYEGPLFYFQFRLAKWVMENSSNFFPCGRPINSTLVQKAMQKLNEDLLQEALLEVKKDPDTSYKKLVENTFKPTFEEGGTLSIEMESKPIREILISTRCDWRNKTIDTSGTVAVRGKKPDALIQQALGLKPGDLHPFSHELQEKAHERVYDLGLFNEVFSGTAIDVNKDSNTITWLICIKQKNEAELAYLEASKINISISVESAKQAIAKYQESIELFQRMEDISPVEKTEPQNLMSLPIMTVYRGTDSRRPTKADALAGLATTYLSLGEFYRALNYYNQALALVRVTDSRDTEASILTTIADIHTTLGDREQARRYYERALSTRLPQLSEKDGGGRKP
ncbi:MAG: tetratricopeptide repeat protein [Phormidium tanganyikae FI6-MK23]|jgi:hypothetical protein|nr:tetratricopeptide repeat protein [Phormidium tanganyikae FI6-MK23]